MRNWLKKYDVFNRALCVLAAFLLWFYVVDVQKPTTTATVRNVPVSFVGKDQLVSNYGITLLGNDTQYVSISISGRRENVSKVSSDKILVTVDLSTVDSAGVYNLPYQVSVLVDGITVVGRNPSTVSVAIDKVVTKSLPVKLDIQAEASENYYIGDITTDPATVTIKGPESVLDKTDYAYVLVSKEEPLTKDISANYNYVLRDADNKEISADSITKIDESVKVDIAVGYYKEVPLVVDFNYPNSLDESMVTSEISPKTITLSGNSGILEKLNYINIGTVDLAGVSDGTSVELPIIIPNGLTNMSGTQSASVIIRIQGLSSQSFTIDSFDIRAGDALMSKYDFTVIDTDLDVTLSGRDSALSSVTPDAIQCSIDIDQLVADGILELPDDTDDTTETPTTDDPFLKTLRVPVTVQVADENSITVEGEYEITLEVTSK